MIFWGATYHVAKGLVKTLDPYICSLLRWGIASIILTVMLYKEKSFAAFRQPLYNWFIVSCIGIFSIGLFNLFFFGATARIAANLVSTIMATTPCITIICSWIFFKERLNFLTIIGIILAFCGAVFAINLSASGCGNFWCDDLILRLNFGELLAFLMALGAVGYSLLLKKSMKLGMDNLTTLTLSAIVGTVFLAIVALFKGNYHPMLSLTPHAWSMILYLGVFGSALNYKWYGDALKEIEVSRAVIFVNTIPLTAILIGVLFFKITVTYQFFNCGIYYN